MSFIRVACDASSLWRLCGQPGDGGKERAAWLSLAFKLWYTAAITHFVTPTDTLVDWCCSAAPGTRLTRLNNCTLQVYSVHSVISTLNSFHCYTTIRNASEPTSIIVFLFVCGILLHYCIHSFKCQHSLAYSSPVVSSSIVLSFLPVSHTAVVGSLSWRQRDQNEKHRHRETLLSALTQYRRRYGDWGFKMRRDAEGYVMFFRSV